MPYPANEARRRKFSKTQYRVRSWGEYDQALQNRGSLTVWVTPEALETWHASPTGKRGRSPHYSHVAIETGQMPWRQTESLLRSITHLLGISLAIADHTTFSRRSATLSLTTALKRRWCINLQIDIPGRWQDRKGSSRQSHRCPAPRTNHGATSSLRRNTK